MSGLSIKVNTNFSSVISDLSFLKSPVSDKLAYRGQFGGAISESLLNSYSGGYSSKITAIESRSPTLLSFGTGFMKFAGVPVSPSASVGIRPALPVNDLDSDGYPLTLSVSFRSLVKEKEAYRRLYPIASFFFSGLPNDSALTTAPFLCIAAYIDDAGIKKVAAWSGDISKATDDLALKCTVPVDWSLAEITSATVTRDNTGKVTLSVQQGMGSVFTASYQFDKATNTGAESATSAAITYGSMNSRTVTSGEVMMGEFWPSDSMTLDQIETNTELLHLRSSARM